MKEYQILSIIQKKYDSPTDLQEALAKFCNYKPLPVHLSDMVREIYRSQVPFELDENGDWASLISPMGELIATGYDKIVIGDYGAFIEFSEEQVYRPNLQIKFGQEFRVNDERYIDKVKYVWLTTRFEDVKVYLQRKFVSYANYVPDKYYISPHEITTKH